MSYNWAYIFHAPQTDPAKDRLVIDRAGCKSTIVGVPDHAAAVKVAVELASAGAKSIELCGFFGPVAAAEIHKATEGRVALGVVMFGAESVPNVMKAFFPELMK
jgi:hypothetical protein